MNKILLLFIVCLPVFAQKLDSNFVITDTLDKDFRENQISIINEKFEKQKTELSKKYKGKLRKYLLEENEEYKEEIVKQIEKGSFHLKGEYYKMCTELIQELVNKNDSLEEKDITVFVSKNSFPNAYDIGNDILSINLGLFALLKNREQLQSVLAHELAHVKLDHVHKNQIRYIQDHISSDAKTEIKKLKNTKYNKGAKALIAFKKKLYQNREIKRNYELEADSLGFIFFKNTAKNPREMLYEFENMAKFYEEEEAEKDKKITNGSNAEQIQEELNIKKETYKKYFTLPSAPFKEKWLKQEDYSAYNYDLYKNKLNEDSIKTHPENEFRIKKIKGFLEKEGNTVTTNSKPSVSDDTYKKLRESVYFQLVLDYYQIKDYGHSIYIILHLLQNHPENKFLKSYLGHNFTALYKAKKKYQFNKHVPTLTPSEQSDNQIQFLNFLWNLNLEDYKKIGEFYSSSS